MTTNNSMDGTVRRLAWACLAMAGVCTAAFSVRAEAEENDYGDLVRETLSVATLPGMILQHGHVYQVTDDVTVDATMQPGVSALRVPVASAVIIEIASGKTLTVKGGAGYGKIPGGAGIEVPYGAKLVIAGEGNLVATGGAAARAVAAAVARCSSSSAPAVSIRTFGDRPRLIMRNGNGGGGAGGGGAAPGIDGAGGAGAVRNNNTKDNIKTKERLGNVWGQAPLERLGTGPA